MRNEYTGHSAAVPQLILEGGGLRCAFTMGVLDVLVAAGIVLPEVIGVSAGAISGAFYASGQTQILSAFSSGVAVDVREVCSESGLLDMMKFLTLLKEHFRYDYEAYQRSPVQLHIGTMNAMTGETIYFEREQMNSERDMWAKIMASSCLPSVAEPVVLDGIPYYDGGLEDAIPLRQALAQPERRKVVILTQDASYVKKPTEFSPVLTKAVTQFPAIHPVLEKRHEHYRAQQMQIKQWEEEGRALVFRPSHSVEVDVFDTDPARILPLYQDGVQQATARLEQLQRFICTEG